jgi:putative peptidoglycan lipid II flippase
MRRLFSAFATVFGLAFIAKACGALKEIVIADRFGTGSDVDLYVLAFTVATWPAAVLMSILTIALTPVLASAKDATGSQAKSLVAQLSLIAWGLGLVVGVLFYVGFPPFFKSVYAPGGMATVPALEPLLFPMALTAALSIPVAMMTVMLISQGRHVTTLLEGTPSLVLAAWLLGTAVVAADALGLGTALGFVLQLGLLLVVLRATFGGLRLDMPGSNMHWDGLWRGAMYSALGYSILALAPIFEQVVAGRLGDGGIASLGYASRVTALATGLVVTVINRVSLPYFSTPADGARGHGPGVGMMAVGSFAVGVLLMCLLGLLAQPLVALLFQRGQFSAEDTGRVAQLLRWNLTQLAPLFVSVVCSAWLASRGRFREIFVACVLGFMMRVSFAWLGSRYFGLDAVAAAATVGYAAMTTYLGWVTLARLGATTTPPLAADEKLK